MVSVYILYSTRSDNRFYVGISADVTKRLQVHNQGAVFSTRAYRPWALLYSEECSDYKEARQREKYFKSGSGREKVREIFRSSTGYLPKFHSE